MNVGRKTAAPLLQLAIAKIAAALSLSTASHRPAHHDKVRISEIMEAPNIAQEENKKLRATMEDLTRRLNIVEEENKKLREAASSAASAMAGSQHNFLEFL